MIRSQRNTDRRVPIWKLYLKWFYSSVVFHDLNRLTKRSIFIHFQNLKVYHLWAKRPSIPESSTLPSPSATHLSYLCFVYVLRVNTYPTTCGVWTYLPTKLCVHHLPDNQLHLHHHRQIRTCPTCPLAAGGWSRSTWKPKCGVPPPKMQICNIDFFCFYPHYRTILL